MTIDCPDQSRRRVGESPEALLALRFQALAEGDFISLYASYLPDAPLLQQFADCVEYLHFAEQQLRSWPTHWATE